MMTRRDTILIALALVATSAALYGLHYAIFRDAHHMAIYLLGDIAFVPIEVLLITLIVDRLLEARARQAMLEKMNMVIGTFFSVLGAPLLGMLRCLSTNADEVCGPLAIAPDWTETQIRAVRRQAESAPVKVRPDPEGLTRLRELLGAKQDFVLGLLQNPNLLEHDSFTDLLWSLTHLHEELAAREHLSTLPASDLHHLSGDIHRLYQHLLAQWVDYMAHLRSDYPYLFSFQARMNPMRPAPGPIVTEG